MKRIVLVLLVLSVFLRDSTAQNVFNPADPIVRYDQTKPLGNVQHPNPDIPGLQKWVSSPVVGVSVGSSAWDASSYKQYFLNANGGKMAFRVKFPKSYGNPDSASKKYPVMLFLHGGGEVGCPSNGGIYNNERQIWIGGRDFMNLVNNNKFDGFLLYPQLVVADNGCFFGWGGAASSSFNAILAMVDSMAKYTRADNDRLLVDGLSGGGYGAWRMVASYPQRVAKIMPSAAAGSVSEALSFVHIPIWFATGGKDPDPSPAAAEYAYAQMQKIGSNIRYTQYPELGHAVWYNHWQEPDFIAELNDVHKANPLVFFQKNEFCAAGLIDAKLGITQGFFAYEWQKDGVDIASRLNGVNRILDSGSVSLYTGNDITVRAFGTYRVRFKRTAGSEWSAWSPKPAVVKFKTNTETPPITVAGARSKVLPAPDGSTTVPLQLPGGFEEYEWYNVNGDELVGTSPIFNAPVGQFKARYAEKYGCGTSFSPIFTVIDANGAPKPDPAANLISKPVSETSIRLDWTQGANETGIEVYRSKSVGGPYTFVALTPANTTSFQDEALEASTLYFYIVRTVNNTGASASSNESLSKTLGDTKAPMAPSNLQYRGSKQDAVFLKWTAPTDDEAIKQYDIYANGVKLYSTSSTEFTAVNLDSLTSYSFVVKAIDQSGNTSPASNQVTGYTHRQGVNYKYYNGAWTALPPFETLTPVKTGTMDTVSINTGVKTQASEFAFLWDAYIYIPVAATYTFETLSDDGSKLYIDVPYTDNATALVNNDSVHNAVSKSGSVLLSQGYHRIAMSYFQNTAGSNMQLFWSNDAGLAREKISKYFFSHTNVSLPGIPVAPSGLAATATAYNKIRLNWTDNSNNESGFEVVRSLTANGSFMPVGTTAPNAVTYTDSGLTASTVYFYKIRAVRQGGESAFTDAVNDTTLVEPLTPAAPSQLVVNTGASNGVSLSWNDNSSNETNFEVYRSTDNVAFTLVATLPPNANAYSDLTAEAKTVYYYYVAGVNAAGTGEASNHVQISAGNTAPVISALNDLSVKTETTVSQDFTVTDDPGDVVTVTIENKPSFIALSSTGGTGYRITASPASENIGSFSITVVAEDNNGKSSSQQLTIAVGDKNTRSVLVNFGRSGNTAPQPWNNWLDTLAAGSQISALRDENNAATAFAITAVTGWSGITNLGHITGNNSGIVPDVALESGIANNGGPSQIKFSGLSASKQYNLVFIGSQNEGMAATAEYATGNQKAVLNARNNTNQAGNLNNLVPDANGELLVTVTRTGNTAISYLNALIIEEYEPSITLLNPGNLYAEPKDRNSIALTWTDRTNNEAAVNGYEIQRASDSLFTDNVETIAVAGNATDYLNSGLTPNTRYWYRIRAKNGSDYSGYSNRAKGVTPASIVYVNFNTIVADAPAPWNNLVTPPMEPFTTPKLKNQSGATTTISLTLEKVFNGEFSAGMKTGNNSGVVPDNVLASDYWLDNLQLAQFSVAGLNHNKLYRVGFVGSASPNGWTPGNYTSAYSINDRTVYLNAWQNTSKIVYIGDVSPDNAGELMLNFSTSASAAHGFTSGIIIEEYSNLPEGVDSTPEDPTDTIPDNPDPTDTIPGNPDPTDTIPGNPDPTDTLPGNPDPTDTLPDNPDQTDSLVKVKVYPNPFSNTVRMEFLNDQANNDINVSVYDLFGQLIYRRDYGKLPKGNTTLSLTSLDANMRDGVYIISLRINGKIRKSLKIIHRKI